MGLALASRDGFLFILRLVHVFFGIIWIGHLYYINFVQGAFFNDLDPAHKAVAQSKLLPRVLWWFRWGAFWTATIGVLYLGYLGHSEGIATFQSSYGAAILIGGLIGIVMALNVWFRIWPAQQIVIASAEGVVKGQPGNPAAAAAGARGLLASRHNVLFSIPMLFFMLSARHLPMNIGPDTSLMAWYLFAIVVIAALEFNAVKGKLGPLTTVKGVLTSGFVLSLVMYLGLDFLTRG